MAAMLEHLHRHIRNALVEVELLCASGGANVDDLAAARFRLRVASVTRTNYVTKLLATVDPNSLESAQICKLEDMRFTFSNLQFAASLHVATWTDKAVIMDWHGFGIASSKIRNMMEDHMKKEAAFFEDYFAKR